VQLDGARTASPFSVEVTSSNGTVLFADDRFQMDYRNRDQGRCMEVVKHLKAKIAESEAPPPPPPTLPTSFLESHLPTKVEYFASLKLSDDLRIKAEMDALSKKVTGVKMLATTPTPTASMTSTCPDMQDVADSDMPSRLKRYSGGDGCCDGGKCG